MTGNLFQMDTSRPMNFTDVDNYANNSEEFLYDYDYWTINEQKYERKNALERNLNVALMVIYSLIFVLGSTGNGLVIFITSFRMTKTVNTVWFLSLAVADFTFIFFLPLRVAHLAMARNAVFDMYMCKFNSTIALLSQNASVYHLVVISVDRCISVRCPVWAQNHRTPRLAFFVVVGVWILALLLCSPNPYFREIVIDRGVTVCFLILHGNIQLIHHTILIFQFFSAFVIPFTVITLCYGALVLRLRRSRLSPSSKPFKVITAVIVAFFVLCFPFHVLSFLESNVYTEPDIAWVLRLGVPLTCSLVYFNSCLNPILYFCMGWDSKERRKLPLLSAFENAFAEESKFNATHTMSSLSTELESRDL